MPKLLYASSSPYSSKVRMAALYAGIAVDLVPIKTEDKPRRPPFGQALVATYECSSERSCTVVSCPTTGSAIAASRLVAPFHSSAGRTRPSLPTWSMSQ